MVAGERVFELMDRPRQSWGNDNAPLRSGAVAIDNVSCYRDDRLVLVSIWCSFARFCGAGWPYR